MATINGTNDNDLLTGTDGSDSLMGFDGNDSLFGDAGADLLDGGFGNDSLVGGTGADDFVFTFGDRVVEGGSSSLADWLDAHGYVALESGVTTQADFVHAYDAWLHDLVNTYALGYDANMDGEVEVSIDQNDPTGTPQIEGWSQAQVDAYFNDATAIDVVTGNHTTTRYFAGSFEMADRVVFSGNGEDTVADFHPEEGDKLVVNGVDAQDLSHFMVRTADVNGDGVLDTHFSLDSDSTWNVTLLGYSYFDVGGDVDLTGGTQVLGTPGDDTLLGGTGNDVIDGLAGDDSLGGLAGDDTLIGGNGNDTMTGGDDADHFVFDFGDRMVEGGSSSLADWLADNGYASLQGGVTTQSEFVHAYDAWLHYLVDTYALGYDANLDGEVEVGIDQNDPTGTPTIEGWSQAQVDAYFNDATALDVVTGNHTTTRYYAGSFDAGDRAIFSGTGSDVITDFNPDEGDRLVVSGVDANTISHFLVHTGDFNGDGTMDTEFVLNSDSTWTVQLLGYSDFQASGDVVMT